MAEIHRKKLNVILKKLNEVNVYLHSIDIILPYLLEYKSGEADRNRYKTLKEKYDDSHHLYDILGIDKIKTKRWMLNSRGNLDLGNPSEYSKNVDKLYKNVEQLLEDFKNLEIRIKGTLSDIEKNKKSKEEIERLRISSNLPTTPNHSRRGGKISIKKSKKRTRTITKNKKTKNKRTKNKKTKNKKTKNKKTKNKRTKRKI
jgi:hypothetical protein